MQTPESRCHSKIMFSRRNIPNYRAPIFGGPHHDLRGNRQQRDIIYFNQSSDHKVPFITPPQHRPTEQIPDL